MIIRKFQKQDTRQVSRLIYRTFRKFNGREYFRKGIIREYLDQYDTGKHTAQYLYERFRQNPVFLVAVDGGRIIGMIRGGKTGIGNLFVEGNRHRKGTGTKLMAEFEKRVGRLKAEKLKVRSTLYATPFYQSVGFRKTTGIRNFRGHKTQPMMKILGALKKPG